MDGVLLDERVIKGKLVGDMQESMMSPPRLYMLIS
jgi:hypothetical protein